MNIVIGFAVAIVVIFTLLGLAKVLALAPARALAAQAGFSTEAYRGIGTLELAGAVGVALGPAVPVLGVLAAAGIDVVGENRAQDLERKHAAYGDAFRWHFIGHLQSNKAKDAVALFDAIHSVDRPSLAEALAKDEADKARRKAKNAKRKAEQAAKKRERERERGENAE